MDYNGHLNQMWYTAQAPDYQRPDHAISLIVKIQDAGSRLY